MFTDTCFGNEYDALSSPSSPRQSKEDIKVEHSGNSGNSTSIQFKPFGFSENESNFFSFDPNRVRVYDASQKGKEKEKSFTAQPKSKKNISRKIKKHPSSVQSRRKKEMGKCPHCVADNGYASPDTEAHRETEKHKKVVEAKEKLRDTEFWLRIWEESKAHLEGKPKLAKSEEVRVLRLTNLIQKYEKNRREQKRIYDTNRNKYARKPKN